MLVPPGARRDAAGVRADGTFGDEELEHVRAAAGSGHFGAIPSFATDYRRPAYHPYPSAAYAWLLALAGLALWLPAFVAVPIAYRAGRRGNRSAWFALAFAIAVAVGYPALWSLATSAGALP
jgi:hypothetical protein